MLPSSVRRVVSAAPSIASSAPRAVGTAAMVPVLVRSNQRRCSSSKPSRSDNGSSGMSTGQSVGPSSASARSDKAGGDKRKRKNKDAADSGASFRKLPSVPSTHHMSQEALGLSSFFSLHRPISITQTMPRTVTDEHFASIFAPRTKANRMAHTVSTLSNTIDQLESPMAQVTIGSANQDDAMDDGMHKVHVRNPDGSESSIYLQVDAMSGDFLPFRPPPLPESPPAAETDGAAAEAEAVDEALQHRVYKAMFTVEETTEPDGQIRIVAHSPRIITDEQPRSLLVRMARRQMRFGEAEGGQDMHALSVKRQRKLKIKKKKYKKLMRRTRNQRRKLNRS